MTEPPLNVHAYESEARALLSPMVYDFVAGGSGDERTLRACRAAFARWDLVPRVLRQVATVSTATSVLGQPIGLPVIIAPTSLHALVHADGERATARAARAAGTIYTMSTASSIPIEQLAPDAGPWWFQLYVFGDRGLTRELVDRAVAAGASALVVTVDTPVLGRREADEQNGFAIPAGITMANLPALEPRPDPDANGGSLWTRNVSRVEPALGWADIAWLASLAPVPIVLKGMLHPADAVLACEHGVRAVVVSNHGGRQLDGAVASLMALPAIATAVAGRTEVLLDGGIRRGIDILIARALGARAVLIGRPIHWGLAVAGEAGVRHILELLQAELARDLRLCGLASPAEVDRTLVTTAGTPAVETTKDG